MNATLFLLRLAGSLKNEAKVIGITLAVLLILPAFVVIAAAESGLSAVSSALAWLNPVTHMVEVKDPKGNLIAQLNATTAWPARGIVTTEFGDPTPYQDHHTGTDIALKAGEPITTFMEGTVIKVENNPSASGYGIHVIVSHGNNITSLYGHMEATKVSVGQKVKPGDVLGLEGATGHVTGVHLHFEIRVYDVAVNPRTFMVGDPQK